MILFRILETIWRREFQNIVIKEQNKKDKNTPDNLKNSKMVKDKQNQSIQTLL